MRVDHCFENQLRTASRYFLDLNPTLATCHQYRSLSIAINQHTQVELTLNPNCRFDQDFPHNPTLRARLGRDQRSSQQLGRRTLSLLWVGRQMNSSAFAASSSVNLSFHRNRSAE